jgi:DNA-binding response OmpR family regulator
MNKILVVDDDADILTLVKLTLSIHGFDVEASANWENINTTIHNYNPDLILLDVSLGGADGREICKRLKLSSSTGHIPIILFSANVEMEKSIRDCHAQAFISKPYELPHLLQVIKTNINESKTNRFDI